MVEFGYAEIIFSSKHALLQNKKIDGNGWYCKTSILGPKPLNWFNVLNDLVIFIDPYGLLLDSIAGKVTGYVTKMSISPWVDQHVDSPEGRRIIKSGIAGATGGAVTGAVAGGFAGAALTGPLAGIGAVPGIFVGGTSGFFNGLAMGLLTQTAMEVFGVPDKINEIKDNITDKDMDPCK